MRENEVMSFIPTLEMPPWMNRVDIFQLPTIQELLQQNDFSMPVTQKDWHNVTPRILQEINSYTTQIQERLFEFITPDINTEDSSSTKNIRNAVVTTDNLMAMLNAPTTFFRCKCCSGSLLRYPMLLSHTGHASTKVVVDQRLRFDNDATTIAKSLFENLGSPAQSLDEVKFQCLRCAKNLIPPLSWDDLVSSLRGNRQLLTFNHFLGTSFRCQTI